MSVTNRQLHDPHDNTLTHTTFEMYKLMHGIDVRQFCSTVNYDTVTLHTDEWINRQSRRNQIGTSNIPQNAQNCQH